MASSDRPSSSKQGQKIPNLKQPLLEPKTYTPRSTKSASFSDSRSGPLCGHKDNFDGGLPWKSKSSSFSGIQSRLKDKTESKNEENGLNKGEDTNEKGAGVVYRQNHAGTVPAPVPKSTNIKCDENKKSEINPKLAISKGRNSNTNTMTNILNTAHALETKQHEIEASDVKNLHSQHEGENYVMSRQNNNNRPALRNRDITGIISELETRRSSNREYDDKVSELTSYEVQISENNSVLCLLHKHAFAIKENVKMTVDLQSGFLVISGEDETDVREVENVARCKLDTVRTERLFLPEYQVPFVQKDRIQGLINETLEHRHICCYWKIEESYISVTAWENETVTDWCRMYIELFHSRELDIFHDQGSTKKLVSLSRSQYWEVIEKSVKVKYGDLFSVREFSKDGRRYLGVIAPRQIFDKIWDELEMAVKRFEPFVEAYSLNKQTSQKTDILKTHSGSYEKFEEDERIILEKIEIGFNEDQTAHQAEKHIVDVEALNSVAKQDQITECIQMPNFNNHKIKSTEGNAASQQLISEIHDKEKRFLGEESEYQLGAENDVGGRATESLDYNSATKLQKNIEHEFETDKVNKQVKESKKINTVHWTGETCEEKTRDKVHVGQRTNQIKDDDIEHGAATYPFQSCKHDGQQATRCMDSDNELVVEKQNKDVDSIKEVIKDSNISHEAGSTSENNFVINTQVGHQLKRSRDNEIKLENGESNTAIDKETISVYGYESSDRTKDERQFGQLVHQNMDEAATNSFYKPPPHEHDEQQIFGKEDSNDALERKRHHKDPDLEKAKIKYNKVVNVADIPTIDRTEDEGEQVNQSKNNKMELDSATDSYPEFPYSGQAMISVDMGGKPEVEKLYKDAGLKTAISKEANSVYDDESAFTDRARGERQLGQLVHQREQDKIDGAATVFYKPPPYESAGQHTIGDEDSDGANKINIQLLESDSENAILMNSNTDNDADVTTKTRNRDNGLQVNESKDDKMKAGTNSCHKSLLSENDKQQTISGQSVDKLEVEKQQKDAESKTGIWHDNNPVNEPESRNRDETRVRQVELQVHQSKNDEIKLDIVTGSCYELSFDKHDGWQTSSSEDSKNKLGLEQHHKDAKSKLPIENDSLTVYEAESTSTSRNKDERLIEKQVNESKENGMKLEDATGYFHKSSFSECGGQQAAKNEDVHDTIKPKTEKLAGNGGAIVKNQEASLMAGESPKIEGRENLEAKQKNGKETTLLTLAGKDIHRWKFAVNCPTVYKRISNSLKTEIEVTAEGHVKGNELASNITGQVVRDAIFNSSFDVNEKIFKFNSDYLEEIEEDFKQLRNRNITKNRPVNPYSSRDAQVSVIEKENNDEVFLIALAIYFEACYKDVEYVLKKYENENNEHKGEYTESPQGEQTVSQENNQNQKLLHCEKWKFDHLHKSVKGISKYEKDFNVEIKSESEDKVLIMGTDPVKVKQATHELQRQINTVVQTMPSVDCLYIWRFAFSCSEVFTQIRQNIPGTVSKGLALSSCDHDSGLIIQFDNDENIMSQQELRDVISEVCKDVKKKEMFTVTKKVKEKIKSEIETFKILHPKENPFSLKRAEVFVEEEKNSKYKIILVALKSCFRLCYDLIDNVVNRGVTEQPQGDSDSAAEEGKVSENKTKKSVEANNSEKLQAENSSGLVSVSINCEKWKYKCLTNIDNTKDEFERKFNVIVGMKDICTLHIQGKYQDVQQARIGLAHEMKKFVKVLEPVTEESYENLYVDQNYRERVGVFENMHHVIVELGQVLNYETDVEIYVGELHVILTKDVTDENLVKVELIKTDCGIKCVVEKTEISWKTLNELAKQLIKRCTDSLVIMLDNYDGQLAELTNFLADIIPCLQGYTAKEPMCTLYICTQTHEKFFGVKELLQKFDQPMRAANWPKTDQVISIEVIEGELANQEVDVILNSSNDQLDLDQGAVSKSVLKVAGQAMQKEIKDKYPNGIRPGEIAETKGYKLKAEHVFHSCLSSWNVHAPAKNDVCLKDLRQVIKKSFERTEQLHHRTIAFPALGTGVLKFPRNLVAREMTSAALSYNKDNPQTCIQKVFFVIYPSDRHLYQIFKQTLDRLISEKRTAVQADILKYCVVISGRKEHVKTARAKITEELLQPNADISGNSQRQPHTQNMDVELLNAGNHAESQDERPATQAGQRINMAVGIGGNTGQEEKAEKQIESHEQRGLTDMDEQGAESFDPDPAYDKIETVKGLTADKGAIPKRSANPGRQGKSPKSFVDPSSDDNSKDMELEGDRKKGIDPSCDAVLDKYLQEITVSLGKEHITDLQSARLNTMVRTLAEHGVEMKEINRDEFGLKGKARDLAAAEKNVIDLIDGSITTDSSEKDSSDDDDEDDHDGFDDDDDDGGYVNLDPELEEHVFEKTISQRFSIELQQKQLKNVRREVFMLMKIFYETKWEQYSSDCHIEFSGNDLTLESKDKERLREFYHFVKQSLTQLDDFYYRELDPNKPVTDIMDVVRQIQNQAKGTWDRVHVFEDDGIVRIAGSSFENVDEFHKVAERRLSGNQPSSRASRKLNAKLDTGFDNRSVSNSFKGKADANRREVILQQQDKRKIFHTDECIKIFVYKASILYLNVDCIVNAANSSLAHGGGIAKVIAQAAGFFFVKESEDYIATHGKLQVGRSCITTAGKLRYKAVIHTVGPDISEYRKDELEKVNKDLYDAIYSCLDMAKANQFRSIGIPSVSSGVFGVPKRWCALQYCLAVEEFSRKNSDCCLKEIHFIDIDEEMLQVINLTCETVFHRNKTAKKELEKLKCSPNKTQKFRVPKFLKRKKNVLKKKSKDVYPRIKHSLESKLKIEVSPGLIVAVMKGNIVDFKKGVIVCPQDPQLRCEGEVAVAIRKHDYLYRGNLINKYGKRKREFGDVLDFTSKCLDCTCIYNVVVPQKMKILHTLSLCYIQVLQKADENNIEKIAVPLFLTDSQKHVEQCTQILTTVLIGLVNTKGKQHRFPNVYVYTDNGDAVQTVANVMKEMLIEERNTIDKNLTSVYYTPPTSPVAAKKHQIERQASTRSQQSEMLEDRISNINETDTDDGDIYESIDFEQHGERKAEDDHVSVESMKCVICMDTFRNPKTLTKCGHIFCTDCIDQCFKIKTVCPVCSIPYGILTGTQPEGEMRTEVNRYPNLPGYDNCGYIQINYRFPDGIQQEDHPNPGKPYRGTRRTAYLPNNPAGQTVLKLLKIAFERKLIFTIGRSVTTGTENIVTWNDIHHKTKIYGGPSNYGYPDPDYLKRVTDELEAKGVTENDIV